MFGAEEMRGVERRTVSVLGGGGGGVLWRWWEFIEGLGVGCLGVEFMGVVMLVGIVAAADGDWG